MRIAGVDPGNAGAIAVTEEEGDVIIYDMHTYITEGKGKTKTGKIKKHTVLDETELRAILDDGLDHVFIEKAQSMPGQGSAGTFNYAASYGLVLKTPIELLVKGGEKTIINIPVTQAVCLMGRVMVYRYENNFDKASPSGELRNIDESRYVFGNDNSSNSKLIEDYGLVNVIIELKNNTEIKRVITDRQGYFEFKELRPGIWTLKIYNNNLPEYHYLEKDTFELELKPGQITKVSVKVLPMKRRIRIISEPQNLFEEKQK